MGASFAQAGDAGDAGDAGSNDEIVQETRWQGLRLVVAHSRLRAAKQSQQREARIRALVQRADQLAGKLDAQDEGKVHRGRKLSDSGAKARFFHEVCDAHLSRIIKVDLKSELFSWSFDETALARAQLMDGKLMLVTNVQDMTSIEAIRRYKSLAVNAGRNPRLCDGEDAVLSGRGCVPAATSRSGQSSVKGAARDGIGWSHVFVCPVSRTHRAL